MAFGFHKNNDENTVKQPVPVTTKKKLKIAIIIALIGAIVLASCIMVYQPMMSGEHKLNSFNSKLDLFESGYSQLGSNSEEVSERYDFHYQAKADTAALLFRTNTNAVSNIAEVADTWDVSRMYVISNGTIQASSNGGTIPSEFLSSMQSGTTPDPISVSQDDTSYRWYASWIDANSAVVISFNDDTLTNASIQTSSLESLFSQVDPGDDAIAFCINDATGALDYFPADNELGISATTGQQATDICDPINLQCDSYSGYMNIGGTNMLVSSRHIDTEYFVCATPASVVSALQVPNTLIAVVAYLLVASILIAYAYFVITYSMAEGKNSFVKRGKYYVNTGIVKKVIPLGVGCAIAGIVITVYAFTLLQLSSYLVQDERYSSEAQTQLLSSQSIYDNYDEEASDFLKNKAQMASYVVSHVDQSTLTRNYMIQLRDALGTTCVWYYGTDGSTIASDDDFWGYKLSFEEDSFSYNFTRILLGKTSSVVVDSEDDWEGGGFTRYAGYVVQDNSLRTIGVAEVGMEQQYLENMQAQLSLKATLAKVQPGSSGFAFAINKSDGTFAYHPDNSLVGSAATSHGMTEEQIKAGYSDLLTLDGSVYLASSVDANNYYVYVVTPSDAPFSRVLPLTGIATIVSLFFLVILMLWICMRNEKAYNELQEQASQIDFTPNSDMVNVKMPDGRIAQTQSAISRWSNRVVPWEHRTPGQKIGVIIHAIVTIVALAFLVMVLFADSLFPQDSLIHYLFKGSWSTGFNIFAITRCIMVVLVAYAIMTILQYLIRYFANSMGAKGETLMRLLDNVIKFAFVIGIIYYCLSMIGVDTTTLLASAGILTLIVGLGAKSLVSDILAGLSIIFESEFQVGDIVTIDGFRGTVMSVGVRTTKVKDGTGNIKIFSNSSVKNVLNMTKDYSTVSVNMGIEYGESLEYVESMLLKELPGISERIESIITGPFYKGVCELADSSVNIQIVANCAECDRAQCERDLMRELKLIFDKYNINIPYPVVSISKDEAELHSATDAQKEEAEEFVEKERELSRELREAEETDEENKD